jgi:PKD repeat protein
MLVVMMLPTDIAMARGPGAGGPTATNQTIESLVADFIFYIPACSSCSGITFTDKSTGGVKPYKYNWDFGDASTSTRQNPRHRYAGDGTYNVTLTVTDKAGNVASTSETVILAPKEIVEPDGGAPVLPVTETPFCTTTGDYTVCTDKADYGSGETVHISGSGFAPGARLTIKVTRPDGSVVTGDGSFAPWPTAYDAVTADLDGKFDYNHVLDGIQGEYLVQVLDGGTSVTVGPGESITIQINVTTSGSSNDWESTSWRISTTSPGTMTCVNTPNHTSSGTYTETFSITAPSTAGTYNAYFRAHDGNSCSSTDQSSLHTMTNAVVVVGIPTVPNPPLTQSCGLDVVLVIDGSGSIDNSEYSQMQAALVAFVNALAGTPTQFAFVEFATSAVVRQGFTADATTIINEINKPRVQPGGQYTNWQQGLLLAHNLFPNRDNPDLIIFASMATPTALRIRLNQLLRTKLWLRPLQKPTPSRTMASESLPLASAAAQAKLRRTTGTT